MSSPTVCIAALTIHYLQGGGHQWVYLNWALGMKALGFEVIWLEPVATRRLDDVPDLVAQLKHRLAPYGLDDSLALVQFSGDDLPAGMASDTIGLDQAVASDLLVNFWYQMPPDLVERFGRTVLLDIDPGLLQGWMARNPALVAPHDLYFTTGETVGRPGSRVIDVGVEWLHTNPCVALEHWPVTPAPRSAAYTTVSHWQMGEYEYDGDEVYSNDKRTGFLPFRDLPRHTEVPLELALHLAAADAEEAEDWRRRGWRIRNTTQVSSTPSEYQAYIQSSRGEFSAAKPSCVRLQNAWISDRTLCYLASGKPAVVQHTGPSPRLSDRGGLFRVESTRDAVNAFQEIESDYEKHARIARELTEQKFGATETAARLLEEAIA